MNEINTGKFTCPKPQRIVKNIMLTPQGGQARRREKRSATRRVSNTHRKHTLVAHSTTYSYYNWLPWQPASFKYLYWIPSRTHLGIFHTARNRCQSRQRSDRNFSGKKTAPPRGLREALNSGARNKKKCEEMREKRKSGDRIKGRGALLISHSVRLSSLSTQCSFGTGRTPAGLAGTEAAGSTLLTSRAVALATTSPAVAPPAAARSHSALAAPEATRTFFLAVDM